MWWVRAALLAAILSGGCDGQAGVDYNGQPLAVLKGVVENQSTVPPVQQIDAALLWHAGGAVSPDSVMSSTPVMIEKVFPALFTITIYLPAPAVAFQDSSLPYAVADIGAIEHGAPTERIVDGTAVLGRISDPLLYYFRTDVPPLTKGYHLIGQDNQEVPLDTSLLLQVRNP